jgi:hypothetical protein
MHSGPERTLGEDLGLKYYSPSGRETASGETAVSARATQHSLPSHERLSRSSGKFPLDMVQFKTILRELLLGRRPAIFL